MALAAQFSEYGTAEVVAVTDVPSQNVGLNQVRLKVRAAGVNPIDWKILSGEMREQISLPLPAGLGSDVAGVIDQVGEGVTAFQEGEEVLGSSLTPSFAETAIADPASLVIRPVTVPWEVAGSLAGAGGTAWVSLAKLGLVEGEVLLVHAAAGGVGTFATQLARARGVRVIGTASPRNHERLRAMGVLPVSYGDGLVERVRALVPTGVDAVLDASGRGEIPASIELAGGPRRVLTLVAFDEAHRGIQVHVGGAADGVVPALREILSLIEQRRLLVPIERSYPLHEVVAALDASRSGHVNGKVVISLG